MFNLIIFLIYSNIFCADPKVIMFQKSDMYVKNIPLSREKLMKSASAIRVSYFNIIIFT